MATNRTFTMIKPDAVEKGYIGGILNMITQAGFRIVSMKLTQLTVADAKEFYAVHKERPFYGELVEFMSRGPNRKSTRLNSSHVRISYAVFCLKKKKKS